MEAADAPAAEDVPEDDHPLVRAIRHSEDRTVFSEEDNTDGWIATDYTVDLSL